MGREAVITLEQVAAAADQIKSEGKKPTVRSIRESLGGGSMGTILRFLGKWKEGQGLASEQRTTTDDSLDPSIARAISTVMSARIQAAVSEINGRFADLQAETGDLIAENEIQAQEISENLRKIENQTEELAVGTGRISQIEAELSRMREERDASVREAGQTKTDLAKALLKLESLPNLEAEIEKLRESLRSQEKARAESEKEAAVASSRAEALVRQLEEKAGRIESLEKNLQERAEAVATETKARADAEQQAAVRTAQAESMAERIQELRKREMRLESELESERTAHSETRKERDKITETLIRKAEAESDVDAEEDGPSPN